jgi:type I site-specific restriction endonuclease
MIPDFNHADYTIGFHNIIYLDRYFRKTTLIWIFQKRYLNIKNKFFEKIRRKVYRTKKKKFCAAVISNIKSTDRFRINFINELSKYKRIDMGGKYKNNVGGRIKNKIKFLSSYKFSIAMENTEGQGYISEKILDSFLAGTIPIYYGGYMIDEFINPKSYNFNSN